MSESDPPWRRPVKSLPSADDYRAERRQQMFDRSRRARQALIAQRRQAARLLWEEYYVIHAHAGAMPGATFQLNGVNMIFYCREGATTQEAERANPMASWPRLLTRLRTGETLPQEHVVQTIVPGNACRDYLCFSGNNIPDNGIYYVWRTHSGLAPITARRIVAFAPGPVRLSFVLANVILPDAQRRQVPGTVNVHWVACRVQLNPVPPPAGPPGQ